MKMAKATAQDMAAALQLVGMIEDVELAKFPRDCAGLSGADEPEEFDEDNPEHIKAFYQNIMKCFREHPAALGRVVWGFQTILDNNVLDPDKNVLELHPRLNSDDLLKAAKKTVSAISHLRDVQSSTVDRAFALRALFETAGRLAEAVLKMEAKTKETPA